MAFVAEVPGGESSPAVAAMYAAERQLWGYLPNYAALFSHEPSVMTAWRSLAGSIRGNLDRRRFELVTMAAAQARRSSYCSLAHGKFLTDLFHTPDEVAAIADEVPSGPVDEVDRALVDFARLVATAALFREETRGAHARADFPDLDPALDERHTVLENGAPRLVPWQ